MNNKVKVALAFLAGGALLMLNQRRKRKSKKIKTYFAPDGSTYTENHIYKTADGKMYRNGKSVHVDHLEFQDVRDTSSSFNHSDDRFSKNYQAKPQNVGYHHKGNRHR